MAAGRTDADGLIQVPVSQFLTQYLNQFLRTGRNTACSGANKNLFFYPYRSINFSQQIPAFFSALRIITT